VNQGLVGCEVYDEWGMNVEEIRGHRVVARQEVLKGRGRVMNQLVVENIFGKGQTINEA